MARSSASRTLGFGFPEARDAYLGLMLLDPVHRGRRLGRGFLARVIALARERGAPRLLLAVFEDNPRARAFRERERFRVVLTAPPTSMGKKVHVRHGLSFYDGLYLELACRRQAIVASLDNRLLAAARAEGVPAGYPGTGS